MSLKKNIIANYISQFYVTVVGIALVPLYISYMGAEAYGLVGFFTMLQTLFILLDVGLTPTMSRETARYHGGATDALSYRKLVRVLECIFVVVALVGGSMLYGGSSYFANSWLKATHLPIAEIESSLQLMSIIIALRWLCGLYRGAISGSERLIWLSGFNSVITTLRFLGVLPALIYINASPTVFFSFQLVVAVIEFAMLIAYAYYLFPKLTKCQTINLEWAPLKPLLRFSLTIAFTSSVGILATQTDKFILSYLLPLSDYGYYSLAVIGKKLI